MTTSLTLRGARFALTCTVFAVAALVGACSSDTSTAEPPAPRLQAPPDTGLREIPMDGIWRVVEVEIVEQETVLGEATMKTYEDRSLWPPAVGRELEIAGGQLARAGQSPLRIEEIETAANLSSYLNVADGRFALYDLYYRWPPTPGVADGPISARVQIALGATSDDTLAGYTAFASEVEFTTSDALRYGLYRVTLERIP